MKWDRRTHRLVRLALIPFRAAVSGWALWATWTIYDQNVHQADYSDVAAPLLFAFVNGLLTGVTMAMALVVAVFVWYPLPPPD